MKKGNLDFIIAGVQKAGTTSLFKYLEDHPELYLLAEKEGPFFSCDERYERGLGWYLEEFFGDAPLEKLWGKATPDYTADPRVPGRLFRTLPNAKIIVLLRNPVDRARSHFRMSVRKGIETRSFAEAVQQQLLPASLEQARKYPTPTNSYVSRGEYYRILSTYYEYFPANHICVLSFERLRQDPKMLLQEVLRFLEVSDDYVPPNLGTVYHKGGTRLKIPWADSLKKMWLGRRIARAIPGSYRRRLGYWFAQWNVVAEDADGVDPQLRRQLYTHYRPDVEQLHTLIGFRPQWTDEI